MDGKVSFAVVFIPAHPLAFEAAACDVDVAVLVMVSNSETVRLFDFLIDFVSFPARVFKP